MNPYEVDVMKLTPEDYLKMRDRCRELEDKKKQQADYIFELRTELDRLRVAMKESEEKIKVRLEDTNSELSATINRMHGGCERAIELRHLLEELFGIGRNEVVSDDEIRKRMKNLQNEIAQLRKENFRVSDQRNQLADEKKHQASYILELQEEIERIRMASNNSVDSSQAALKDADAKIQSANDRAANAKKDAKEAKERA